MADKDSEPRASRENPVGSNGDGTSGEQKSRLWNSDFILEDEKGLRDRLGTANYAAESLDDYTQRILPIKEDLAKQEWALRKKLRSASESNRGPVRSQLAEISRFRRLVRSMEYRAKEKFTSSTQKTPEPVSKPDEIVLDANFVDVPPATPPNPPENAIISVEPNNESTDLTKYDEKMLGWRHGLELISQQIDDLLAELGQGVLNGVVAPLDAATYKRIESQYFDMRGVLSRFELNTRFHRYDIKDDDLALAGRCRQSLLDIENLLERRRPVERKSDVDLTEQATAEDWEKNSNLQPASARRMLAIVERLRSKIPEMSMAVYDVDQKEIDAARIELETAIDDLRIDIDALEGTASWREGDPAGTQRRREGAGNDAATRAKNIRKARFLVRQYLSVGESKNKTAGDLLEDLRGVEQKLREYGASYNFARLLKEVNEYRPVVWENPGANTMAKHFTDIVGQVRSLQDLLSQADDKSKTLSPKDQLYLQQVFFPQLRAKIAEYEKNVYTFFVGETGGVKHAEIILGEAKLQEIRKLLAKPQSTNPKEAFAIVKEASDLLSISEPAFASAKIFDANNRLTSDSFPILHEQVSRKDENGNEVFVDVDKYSEFLEQNYWKPLEKRRNAAIEETRLRVTGDAKVAIEYFKEMRAIHGFDWPGETWKEQPAEVLARAIWKFQDDRLIAMSKGEQSYIPGFAPYTYQVEGIQSIDKPSLGQLVQSFDALANVFKSTGDPEDIKKGEKIHDYAVRMYLDAAVVGKVFEMGGKLHQANRSMDELKHLVASTGFDEDDLPRFFAMGERKGADGKIESYYDEGISLGARAGRALQVVGAMCDPIVHEEAIRSAGSHDKDKRKVRYVRSVPESNKHSFFPEDRDDATRSDDVVARRWLVRILAGQQEVPAWMDKGNEDVIRKVMSDDPNSEVPFTFADQRQKAARNYVDWLLTGDPAALPPPNSAEYKAELEKIFNGTQKKYKPTKPHEDSFLGQYKKYGQKRSSPWFADEDVRKKMVEEEAKKDPNNAEEVKKRVDAQLARWKDWEKAKNTGYEAELLAYNMYVCFLADGRSAGVKMLPDEGPEVTRNGKTFRLPVIDSTSAPDGVNQLDRIENTAYYRDKLWTEQGGDGAGGPRISLDTFYRMLAPLTEAKAYAAPFAVEGSKTTGLTIKRGDLIGKTLGQAIWSCADGEFSSVAYNKYISGPADKQTYTLTAEMAIDLYQKVIGGLNINWSKITSYMEGSESTPTFDYRALAIVANLSRQVNYLLVRDEQNSLNSWSSDKEYDRFRAVEAFLNEHLRTDPKFLGKALNQPVRVNDNDPNSVITPEEIENFLNFNRRLHSRHILFDAHMQKDVEGQSGVGENAQGWTRYSSDIHDYNRLPEFVPEPIKKSHFEVVLNENRENGTNDEYLHRKKLIIGQLLISDMSVSALVGMSWDDIMAVVSFLSKEKWVQVNENGMKKFIDKIVGTPEREYNGLGIFTEEEAIAMLRTAGVNTGLLARVQSTIERMHSVVEG